jgi:hypothetical protein
LCTNITVWKARSDPVRLDEPGRFAPEVLTYRVRELASDLTDPALRAFERMPPRPAP